MIYTIRRLIFHPAGKEEEDGKDHVSVYARIEDIAASEMLMNNWEINVELKFFIYNYNVKKYSTFQGINIFVNKLLCKI